MRDRVAGWTALIAAVTLVAGAPVLAQDSEPPSSPPSSGLGGFRLPPAEDGRAPGVQGPSDNGLPPSGPADRRPAPVTPPVVTPTVQPSAPADNASRLTQRAPTASSAARTAAQPADGSAASPATGPPPQTSESTGTPADAPLADRAPPLSPITGQVLPPANIESGLSPLVWAALVALALLLGGGLWWQRRRQAVASGGGEWASAPQPAPTPAPSPRKAAAAKPDPQSALLLDRPDRGSAPLVTRPAAEVRPDLAMTLEIVQLAMTATHLAVRFALHLTNRGPVSATGVMVRIAMQQAAAGQDAQLQTFFDGAGGSVVSDDFAIGPGATETVGGEAQLPRERIQPLIIAEKPVLVPVLAFDVTYHWDGPADAFGQVAGAFVVGRETAENSSKLGPLRLDQRAYVVTPAGARATAMQRKV